VRLRGGRAFRLTDNALRRQRGFKLVRKAQTAQARPSTTVHPGNVGWNYLFALCTVGLFVPVALKAVAAS